MALPQQKIAAIDVGTNSFHMVIASVNAKSQLRIHSRDKEMVRLGESAHDMKQLSESAMLRGIKALKRFSITAKKENALIRAIATSATREALNKEEFVSRVEEECGIHIDVVTGNEEGRLVYMGVIHGLSLHEKKIALCDIGGGSTEIVVGKDGKIGFTHSEKIGTIRMTQRFLQSNRPSDKDIAACREFLRGDWGPTLEEVRRLDADMFIATSGTFHTLVKMALMLHKNKIPEMGNGAVCDAKSIMTVIEAIIEARTSEKIAKLLGMESKRADIMLAGALIVQCVIDELQLETIHTSSFALREGIVFDTVQQLNDQRDFHHLAHLRFETVRTMGIIYGTQREHAKQVSKFSLQLFDALSSKHKFGNRERELLDAAALLHDIGYHISPDQHHKHGYYIIFNAIMPGFTNDESELIANIVRYHRKSHPKKKHNNFTALSMQNQNMVCVLAAILRISEGLDRRRMQLVESINVNFNDDILQIELKAIENNLPDIELWGAERRKELLEQSLGIAVQISTV